MEGEKEEQGESTESLSGTTSTSAETTAQNCSEDDRECPNLQPLQEEEEEEKKEEQDDAEAEPSQAEEDIRGAERVQQETLTATDEQGDADCLPLPTEEETTPLSVSSHPSNTHNEPSDPCWYCLRSLDSDYRPEATKEQGDQDPSSPLPSSGQKVSYQTDPRPHFGVAWSSHSTCRPLWGSEGPSWGPRNQEVPDQTHNCPHCYLGLPPETLRWHEAKCLLFEGLRETKK